MQLRRTLAGGAEDARPAALPLASAHAPSGAYVHDAGGGQYEEQAEYDEAGIEQEQLDAFIGARDAGAYEYAVRARRRDRGGRM